MNGSRRGAVISILAMSCFSSCSVASAKTIRRDFDPFHAPSARMPPRAPDHRPALTALVESLAGGSCSFDPDSNSFSYTIARSTPEGVQERRTASFKLDLEVLGAKLVLCSESFSAVSTGTELFVTLGSSPALAGFEDLGPLGDRYVSANVYALSIRKPASESILSHTLEGEHLLIRTARGRTWTMDLSDPWKPWSIHQDY